MTKYREILRLHALKFSERNIALSCCILRRPSAADAMTSGQPATLTATPYEVPFN